MKTLLLPLALLCCASLAHAGLTITATDHRDANDFKRISEHLTGQESQGRYSIYRSNDTRRDGFYVALAIDNKATLETVSSIRYQFVRPGTQDIEEALIPITAPPRKKRLLIGLTDTAWEAENARPLAWKISLLDTKGNAFDSVQSFLWSK